MGPARLPDLTDGEELSAGWLNGLRDLLLSCRLTLDPASGISGVVGRTGTAIHLTGPAAPEQLWVRLTGRTTTSYAWVELLPRPRGTWVVGPRSGTTAGTTAGTAATTPAYEANLSTTMPIPYVVLATLYPGVGDTGELRFSSPACP